MAVIDEIKARVDIVELIGESVQLKKAGRSFVGFCPFHSNTRTPAFTVFPDTQSYHCFGCKASGTAFDFVMQRQGLDFTQALKLLAERAGIQLEERTQVEEQQSRQRTRLLEMNAAAARFFQHLLIKSTRGQPGRDYLARRALSDEAAERFQLGYSADEWSLLLGYLHDQRGFDPDEVEAAGLAIRREHGGFYDRFRGRLIFPIRDAQGQIVGFGGRALGDTQPKYLNTPQTALFDKGSILYGLDLARDTIRSQNAAVIVEGYVDVITAHQHGFTNVVAPLGTALSEAHIKQLKRLAGRVYLALDADAAGQNATLKGLEKIEQSASEEELHAVSTPQGLVRWEADLELRIIALPSGRDPDEVIQENPDTWRALVEQAQPVMDFYLRAYTAGLDLQAARDQATAVERLLPLLARLPEAQQRVYIGRLERMLPDMKAELIVDLLRRKPQAQSRNQRSRPAPVAQPTPTHPAVAPDATFGIEEHLLALLLRHSPARPVVEKLLTSDLASFAQVRQLIAGTISELFERIENRLLWESWCQQPPEKLVGGWLATQPDALREHGMNALAKNPLERASYLDTRAATDMARRLRISLAERWRRRVAQQLSDSNDQAEQQRLMTLLLELNGYCEQIKRPPRSSTWEDLRNRTV